MRILDEYRAVSDRLQTIADEAFGPFPTEPVQKLLTLIEHGISDQIRTIAELERENAELRERARTAEREVERLEARLARHEAPGPALLVAEHSVACEALRHAWKEEIAQYDPPGLGPTEPTCDSSWCHATAVTRAYREQHARCVAVVSSVAWQSAESEHSHGEDAVREAAFAAGVRAALAALTGEGEK